MGERAKRAPEETSLPAGAANGDSFDARRGIVNAVSRFKQQRQSQLLSEQLLSEADRGRLGENEPLKSGGRGGDSLPKRERGGERTMRERRILGKELSDLEKTAGLSYEKGEEELLIENTPVRPTFPGIMLSVALIKDLVDAADVTGVGIILTTIFSFVLSVALFVWLLGKLQGGWWKRKMIRYIWVRYVLAIVIEFIPAVKLIPASTILVLMAHYRETKIVELLNGALERMRAGGIRP